jgi:hypothetical protein
VTLKLIYPWVCSVLVSESYALPTFSDGECIQNYSREPKDKKLRLDWKNIKTNKKKRIDCEVENSSG